MSSTKYYDLPNSEDVIHLLSNPMNDEESDEQSLVKFDRNGRSSSGGHGDCNHCHHITLPILKTLESQQPRSKLVLIMCLCGVFMIGEIGGGYLAGSLAVMTNGAHLFIDLIGFFISFLAISLSRKQRTLHFNYGFYRIEVLTTLASISLIWFMTIILIYLATVRLIKRDYELDGNMMILVSSIGVIINIVMFVVLHGQCGGGHMHSHTSFLGSQTLVVNDKPTQNINLRAATIHVIGDLVQSVGVLISSILIKFYPKAKFMDPICTFVFSAIVICSTIKLLRDSVHILMEGAPKSFQYKNIQASLEGIAGVCQVHSLYSWSLTVDKNAISVHLAVDDSVDRDKILLQAQRLLCSKFGVTFCTIQIEKYYTDCCEECLQCLPIDN